MVHVWWLDRELMIITMLLVKNPIHSLPLYVKILNLNVLIICGNSYRFFRNEKKLLIVKIRIDRERELDDVNHIDSSKTMFFILE